MDNLTPHRLTPRSAALMAVREDPLTGHLTVDPLLLSALEQQGYDPAPFVEHLLREYRRARQEDGRED